MNTAVTSLPKQLAAPSLRPWLARVSATVWRALEDSGRARARRHLLDFADHCEALQPELAKELRSAARHHPQA
ncbi:MAG: hypothetical protein ABI887_21380 [Burkholderiales bacterium]